MTLPPVPAWPPEVLPDEPVHGFFQRLAAANGQLSCRTFANSLGLNGRNFDFEELLEFCRTLPIREIEELIKSTPERRTAEVHVRGEIFSPSQFAFSAVRLCPGCVSESRHHRFWFDLTFMAECPFHGVPLIDGRDDEKFAFWHPEVGVLPHSGVDLARPITGIEPPLTLSRYVLGRLGCINPWRLSHLDDFECREIIQVAEVIGRMRQFGWSPVLNAHGKWDQTRRARLEDGFAVLRDGSDALSKVIAEFTAGSPIKTDSSVIQFAMGDFYGWLNRSVRELEGSRLAAQLLEVMITHANQNGVFSRKARNTRPMTGGSETLSGLAAKLGIPHKAAGVLARKVGVARQVSDKTRHHSFRAQDCQKIFEAWADLISRKDAENLVRDAGAGELQDFETKGDVRPFIRLGGCTAVHDKFRRSAIKGLLSRDRC